jgi:Fic family protein
MTVDPKVPYNSLPKLPAPLDLKDQELLLATIDASDAIAQLKTMLTMNDRNLANTLDLLSPLFVPEAVSSSGIENIITTNNSVYVAKVREERELSPAEKEALNYTEALMAGTMRIFSKGFLATNDYIMLQRILEPSNYGIRTLPGTQLKNPHTGQVFYTPPEGEALLRSLLENFENYFNFDVPAYEIFARMAILHYQFEAVHPFHDGNGRTGRMLMPLFLTKHKKLPAPVLFISRYILEHRDEYYERLRNVTFKGEWKEWILFITRATTEQAQYTCKILGHIQNTTQKIRQTLKNQLPSIYSVELVDFLFSNVYFTQKDFEKALGVSPMTARKYLHLLEGADVKVLTKRKQTGRNRYLYITPAYIRILKDA